MSKSVAINLLYILKTFDFNNIPPTTEHWEWDEFMEMVDDVLEHNPEIVAEMDKLVKELETCGS